MMLVTTAPNDEDLRVLLKKQLGREVRLYTEHGIPRLKTLARAINLLLPYRAEVVAPKSRSVNAYRLLVMDVNDTVILNHNGATHGRNNRAVLLWLLQELDKYRPRNQDHYGTYNYKTMRRFWGKVIIDKNTGCWLWAGCTNPSGYGVMRHSGGNVAHRFSYTTFVGSIPDGLQLDHVCRIRSCVNPEHLEPVTGSENCLRGLTGVVSGEREKAKTHCPHGHPYNKQNTKYYVSSRTGRTKRKCCICTKEHQHKSDAKRSGKRKR